MELFHPTYLGGGFRDVLFSPLFGEDFQFDEHIFHMGWFNHQPVICHDWFLGPPYTLFFLVRVFLLDFQEGPWIDLLVFLEKRKPDPESF